MTPIENDSTLILDPACGSSAFFLQGVEAYNKLSLAHLEAEPKLGRKMSLGVIDQIARLRMIVRGHHVAERGNIRVETLEHLKDICERKEWSDLYGPNTSRAKILPPSSLLDLVTVDTIHLSIPIHALRIQSNHQLNIDVRTHQTQNSVLWRDDAGNPIVGHKATWRCPGISLQIRPMKNGWLNGANVGCFITLNLNTFLGNGCNSWPVNRALACMIVTLLEERLLAAGVAADLRGAQVTRCDLNRTVILSKPFSQYQAVWEAMNLPRTKKQSWRRTGAVYHNNSQGVLFYDKIAQMKSKGCETAHLPRNLARLEWQVKRAINVRKYLGVRTLQDVLDNWNELAVRFVKFEKSVFSYDMRALQVPRPRSDKRYPNPVTPQIQNLMRECRKQKVELSSSFEDLDNILHTSGFEVYSRIVKALPGLNKTYVNGHLRRMEEALVREKALTDPEFVQCYEEIQNKLQGGWCGSEWAYYWNEHAPVPNDNYLEI